MKLVTDRLRLRPLAAADLPLLVTLDSDPAVMRYINGGQPTPAALYENRLMARLLAQAEGPLIGFFVLHRRYDDEPLGWVHNRRYELQPSWLEIGYRLFARHWHQGYATEASRVLRDATFDAALCAHWCAICEPAHHASRRVMAKLGMQPTETYRHRTGIEVIRYELARAAWLSAADRSDQGGDDWHRGKEQG